MENVSGASAALVPQFVGFSSLFNCACWLLIVISAVRDDLYPTDSCVLLGVVPAKEAADATRGIKIKILLIKAVMILQT